MSDADACAPPDGLALAPSLLRRSWMAAHDHADEADDAGQ